VSLFSFGRQAAAPAPAPAPRKGLSPTTWLALAAVGALLAAFLAWQWSSAGRQPAGPNVTVTTQQDLALPKVDTPTAMQMQALAKGPTIDQALRSFALWLDERLLWIAALVLLGGLGLHATHRWRQLGREVMWSAALALVGLLLFPLLVVVLPVAVQARDSAVANGITIHSGRP